MPRRAPTRTRSEPLLPAARGGAGARELSAQSRLSRRREMRSRLRAPSEGGERRGVRGGGVTARRRTAEECTVGREHIGEQDM